MLTNKLTGAGAADKTYIEDVFSTYLYTGNSSNQTITNGIDLAGKGGMVWMKSRGSAGGHSIFDTNRGIVKKLAITTVAQENTGSYGVTAFNSTGFNLFDNNGDGSYNYLNTTYASWTFRKAPKFFDVVTWTGNGVEGRQITHNLGVRPGMIIVKRTDSTSNWIVNHIYDTNSNILLNSNAAIMTDYSVANNNNTTYFTVYNSVGAVNSLNYANTSGATYVAYLFAHDTSTDGLIQCGSYTGNGSSNGPTINLGWEPQYLLIKAATVGEYWTVRDSMRGLVSPETLATIGANKKLYPNTADAEAADGLVGVTSTGFKLANANSEANGSGQTYIYMAIRRGPMRTPTDGTTVFQPGITYTSTSPAFVSNFPVDFALKKNTSTVEQWFTGTRLLGNTSLDTSSTTAEGIEGRHTFDFNKGWFNSIGVSYSFIKSWMFRRAPGFFDVVCYSGDSAGGYNSWRNHNLNAIPEFVIVKRRNGTQDWMTWCFGSTIYPLFLNKTDASPYTISDISYYVTNTQINVGALGVSYSNEVNALGSIYVAYLFASCPGVSKVGSYTGNDTSQNIDCGFTNGARFVLIKRTNATSDWWVLDTARGIVVGNDKILSLNSTAAENQNADVVDPYSAGFTLKPSQLNIAGDTYIYLAIA